MRKQRIEQLLKEINVGEENDKPLNTTPTHAIDLLFRSMGVPNEFLNEHSIKAKAENSKDLAKYELICNASYAASTFSLNFNSIALLYKSSDESVGFVQFAYENWDDIKLTWKIAEELGGIETLKVVKQAASLAYHVGDFVVENHEQIENVLNIAGLGQIAVEAKEAIATAGFTIILSATKGVLFLYNRKDKKKLSDLKARSKGIETVIYLLSKGIPHEQIRPKLIDINRSLWGY